MSRKKIYQGRIKQIVGSIIIILLAAFSINFVLSYEKARNKGISQNELIDREIFLEDKEFSTVFLEGDYIYAGGTQGLFKIHKTTDEIIEILNNDQSFEVVRGIDESPDGVLWIGHGQGLTGLKDDQVVKHYDLEDGLPDLRVNDIDIDQDKMYVATFGGVGIIETGRIESITEADGLLKNITKVVMLDKKGNLWCGSHTAIGGGVTLIKSDGDQEEISYFTTENGLSHNAVTTIIEDEKDNVWIGNGNLTRGGATRYTFKSGEWNLSEVITRKEGLIGEKVRHIFIDQKENVWVCSESEGIAIIKSNEKIIYLTTDLGLSDNEVKKIIYDDEGNLWLASKKGVTKINSHWLEREIY